MSERTPDKPHPSRSWTHVEKLVRKNLVTYQAQRSELLRKIHRALQQGESTNQWEQLRKRVELKLKRAQVFLERGQLKARQAASYLPVTFKDQPRRIAGIVVGRSAQGNERILGKHGGKWYLHCAVRGGSLVRTDAQPGTTEFLRAASLALLYSKNFKTLGTRSGYVHYTLDCRSRGFGSFQFYQSRSLYLDPLPLYIRIGPQISLNFQEGEYELRPGVNSSLFRKVLGAYRYEGKGLSKESLGYLQSLCPAFHLYPVPLKETGN